jgi:tRNA nucleotidyltransferase/poly(A) polymerase
MKTQIKQILREGLVREERIKFDFKVPSDILEIQKVFKKNGYKLYIVGGAVRDALLGKTPKDFDLATDAIPDKVEEMMKDSGFRTLPTGKSFGVINVFTDQGEYEIATFREDIGSGRRPDAVSFTNIEGDVKRRDLTINALFYDIDSKEIVDLVGGVNDLKQGIVRTVGAPEDRFGEDRLRILRAIRFAGRFGSDLDPATDMALQKDASLEGISGERIRDEFIKGIISAKSTDEYLSMLDKYRLFDWVFPNLNVDKKIFRRKLDYKADDYIVVLARLLKNNDIDLLRRKLNDLKYSADEVKTIVFLVSMLKLDVDTAYLLKKMQQTAGVSDDKIRNFGSNEGISSQLLDAFEQFRLSVSGPEAMEKFDLKPGPELGKAIQKMETANFEKLLKL